MIIKLLTHDNYVYRITYAYESHSHIYDKNIKNAICMIKCEIGIMRKYKVIQLIAMLCTV